MKNLSHAAQLARAYDRDRFLLCLFVPTPLRETMFALTALDAELAHVPHAVQEEALGHIRYAWWQETLEAAAAGNPPGGHPVLEKVPPEIAKQFLKLAENYRDHYPEPPRGHELMLDELSLELLHTLCPQAEPGWTKAKSIIDRHRARFGPKWNGWLNIKLLWSGL